MLKGFLLGSVIAISYFVFYLISHLGLFRPVQFTEESRASYFVIFKEHTGSYNQVSEVISNVEREIKSKKLDCAKTFGQYLDDPNLTDEDRLRSWGGCISDHPYPDGIPDFRTAEFPAQKYFVAHFDGSPAVGPWKVYGNAKREMDQRRLTPRGETIEIYTLGGSSISTEYLFPLR